MNALNKAALSELYRKYNEVLKPLLADVEAKYEELPLSVFNELRSFNDHIARCYIDSITEKNISDQLDKANGHIIRAIWDCFKYCNVYFSDLFNDFEKKIQRIDITTINNGEFYVDYRRLRQSAITTVREAKTLETTNREDSFIKYQQAYILYGELNTYIQDNYTNINCARRKFYLRKTINVFLWIFTFLLGYVLDKINFIDLVKKLIGISSNSHPPT